MTNIKVSQEAERYFDALADELEISEERYEQADRSYKSLGNWLNREKSTLRPYGPKVYVQGSFRLGTAIRPINDAEDYDVDVVSELQKLTSGQLTQQHLKQLVGVEVESYRLSQAMAKPLREGRRCWILDYADGAQFHMDVLPALPNGLAQRQLLAKYGLDASRATTAIVITDKESPAYLAMTPDWPRSNPKGFSDWFRLRMGEPGRRRREAVATRIRASVEDIPDYRIRTPLQAAIMILKRHRDQMFAAKADDKPISVILTTLAAHAYQGEEDIGGALVSILERMHLFIETDNGVDVIRNPADPLENFADRWRRHPERRTAFYGWLERARRDFGAVARLVSRSDMVATIEPSLGSVAKRAATRASTGSLLRSATAAGAASATPSFGNRPRTPTTPQGFA